MASKKKATPKGKDIVVHTVALIPATILAANPAHEDVDIPEFLKTEGTFSKEAPTGFTPLIQFGPDPENWQVGSWIIAKYIGGRPDIGPNKSMMYDFEVTNNGKDFAIASLWGSTILDNKMRMLDPQPDQWVFIQYLGDVDTSRGMNPAKDFRLGIVADKVIDQMGYSGKK